MTKKYTYNLETFYNEDDVSYYLLGSFMTDGCIHKSGKCVSITSKDNDWLKIITNTISPNKALIQKNNCWDAVFTCKELSEWFISKGCGPKKSLTLEFPIVPEKYLPDFLRGSFDGDGSISFGKTWRKDRECFETKRQCAIYTSAPKFEKGLRAAIASLGINAFTYERNFGPRKIEDRMITSTNPNWRVALKSGEDIAKFLEIVYYDGNRIAMPRKAAIAKALITDWHRPFFCQDCNVELHLTKNGRCQLYCLDCAKKRTVARQPAITARYRDKQKLLRTESLPQVP